MSTSDLRYFRASAVFTAACLLAAWGLGYYTGHSASAALSAVFIVCVLAVLEVSLSFDNAVVNAKVLMTMERVWQRRFITWGILIAVFGMRIVFPLLIVGVMAEISPWQALVLAATRPDEYARVMVDAHVAIAAFGGAFLAMVGLKYFFDVKKDVHWVRSIEEPLTKLGKIEAVEIALVIIALYCVSKALPADVVLGFLLSGLLGIVTFVAVEGVAALMGVEECGTRAAAKSGLASFLYLEVLDASFSFDGVIGAFALTNNLFIIALGLGVGAMFVRSLTIMLVEKGTLTEYLYLEHGAFWAILALSALMLGGTIIDIPEVVTGLIGAVLIGLSFLSSVRHNRKLDRQ
ncbi:hypothetical protein CU669_14375 [Paramagnetospirillum kuznetsovii]|uniref:DUF475 domain-containing protein n=1 Tax=Paramagnetospirillum kuznetsovii TaxID=2053833 RepID=A0A364NVP6_9PROT|nr:DUF475 domain-containing protein [Paramagnetospirillum kuznetsovii]RAU21136.1 hypothetical protein CU669_14375 [Paramagnetospirillum kuznetsovii]